jgi:glycosyltransferase involved in cell wall biosynthesis
MPRINLHIYPSNLTTESRLFKEVRSLIKMNLVDEIKVVGIHTDDVAEQEMFDEHIEFKRYRLRFTSNSIDILRYFKLLEFLIVLFFKLPFYNRKVDIVNCHSLHVLPVGVWLKWIKGATLIYDAHELETEVNGSKGILRYFSKMLERFCMYFVDELIVVSDSIGKWYGERFKNIPITVIKNIPYYKEDLVPNNTFRELFDIPAHEKVFLYQGNLQKARGVKDILEVFKTQKLENHIVFLGSGPLVNEIKEASKSFSNIHFHPFVLPHELSRYTSSADVGIHLMKNTCLNHYYCLPNKLFEYFMNGIPHIISNFPDMADFVRQNDSGWIVSPTREGLTTIINQIGIKDIARKRKNIQINRPQFGWHIEEKNFALIYNRITKSVVQELINQ